MAYHAAVPIQRASARLIALVAAVAVAVAIASLMTAAPVDAATHSLDNRVLTLTLDNDGETLTLGDNGTNYVIISDPLSAPIPEFPKANVDTIIIDGNHKANAGVLLDGRDSPLSVPAKIQVKNLYADQNSQISIRGSIGISGLPTVDRSLVLHTPPNPDPNAPPRDNAPILLLGPTTITLATPISGTSSIVHFGGRVLGNQDLSIQLPGDNTVARQITFEEPVGVPESGDPTRLASLAVTAGTVQLPSTVATNGGQNWGGTELILPEADATLRASRVTGTGPIICDMPGNPNPCTSTATLTVDVTEVRAGADPGSSLGGVGSSQYLEDSNRRIQLVKTGNGTLSFDFGGLRNRHSAGTMITAGTLRVGHANALGTGSTTVGAAGTLELHGGVDVTGPYTPLSFGLHGTITSTGGSNVLRTPITLLADATIAATTDLELSSYMAGGSHDLTVSGLVDFTGLLDTTGAVRVAPSTTWTTTTDLTTTGSLTVDGDVDLVPGGTPITLTAARLGGAGTIRCGLVGSGSCGEVSIDVSDATGATAFSGGFGGVTGQQSVMTLAKRGAGTLVLSGTSTIQGTDVAAGELRVTQTGRVEQAATVDVAAGARLSGSGTVGVHNLGGGGLVVDGLLDLDGPGGPETMTTSALGIGGGTLEVGIDGPTTHSELLVVNSVTLAGSSQLRVRAGASIPDQTTVVIVRTTFASPIMGTFAGLPEGAIVTPTSGRGTFRITYAGGDGDDIALTYVAPPPEPDRQADPPGKGATTLTATKPRFAKGALITTVTVDGPGRIVQTATTGASGRAKAIRACRATRTAPKAGTYRVACRLTAKARTALKRGKLRLAVTTTFTPTSGTAATTRTTVTVPRSR